MDEFRKWLLGQKDNVSIDTALNEGRKHETTLNSIKHINSRNTNNKTDTHYDVITHKHKQKARKTTCKPYGGDHKGNPDCQD